MNRAKPLRFLALVLGLWIGARAFMLIPPDPPVSGRAGPLRTADIGVTPGPMPAAVAPSMVHSTSASEPAPMTPRFFTRPAFPALIDRGAGLVMPANPSVPAPGRANAEPPRGVQQSPHSAAAPSARLATSSRWSLSAWLLVRDGRSGASLARGGTLGGSQAGARLRYRLGSGVSLSGLVYVPLRDMRGAEVAAGIEWQPWSRLPVRLLAERRQDAGGAGRSAFALTIHGGASGPLPAGFSGEIYGQAGLVGARSRDVFVDVAARIERPVGRRVAIGGGAWGAAQPGASRIDAGPSLIWRPAIGEASLRLQADWRFRIAGDAGPGSGPALTLALDF